jgi:regulator of protease activity HflC (stomatin/prohibitin superfamily)
MHPIVFVLLSIMATAVVVFLMGIRIVRPTHRGLIERLGKYTGVLPNRVSIGSFLSWTE